MPQLFLLCIKADLEGVASVRLPPGTQYCLTVSAGRLQRRRAAARRDSRPPPLRASELPTGGRLLGARAQVKDSAGEDTREGVYVSADELHDLTGSRGTANFVLKWAKDSKREAYLNVQEVKNVTRPLTGGLLGRWVALESGGWSVRRVVRRGCCW